VTHLTRVRSEAQLSAAITRVPEKHFMVSCVCTHFFPGPQKLHYSHFLRITSSWH
jgi:hypothetical protein